MIKIKGDLVMNSTLEFADFEMFLQTFMKKPDEYIGYLKAVMKKEEVNSLEDLASNIAYFQYKYKYCEIEGIKRKTQKDYLAALNRFSEFINPTEQILTFKVQINEELPFYEYKNISLKLADIERRLEFDYNGKEYIKIKDIKEGSIDFIIALCSGLIFSFKLRKALNFIKKIIVSKCNIKKVETTDGILNCASVILDIADILLPPNANLILNLGKTVVELTREIIDLIREMVK